jgi:hypothetical protein
LPQTATQSTHIVTQAPLTAGQLVVGSEILNRKTESVRSQVEETIIFSRREPPYPSLSHDGEQTAGGPLHSDSCCVLPQNMP